MMYLEPFSDLIVAKKFYFSSDEFKRALIIPYLALFSGIA